MFILNTYVNLWDWLNDNLYDIVKNIIKSGLKMIFGSHGII